MIETENTKSEKDTTQQSINEDDSILQSYEIITKEDVQDVEKPLQVENLNSLKDKAIMEGYENLGVAPIGRFRKDPIGYVKRLTEEMSYFYQGKDWRSYENYLGASLFDKNTTLKIKKNVMESERMSSTVTELVEDYYQNLNSTQSNETLALFKLSSSKRRYLNGLKKEHLIKEALTKMVKTKLEAILDKLMGDLTSLYFIKLYGFTLNIVFNRMYHQGIYINEVQFKKIRSQILKAHETNTPIIVLPCHKSHMDYLVISYVFFRLGLSLPYIAAGENLDLPVIGTVLRKGGAFFIKRKWDSKAYELIVREYIHQLLSKGFNMEVFIEGTRSRTGKLLNPKFGILKILLDGLLEGRYNDLLLLPISIGYDRVVEASTYVSELLGTPKEKESIMGMISNSNILQLKWGRVEIRFSTPFSLKEFIDNEKVKRKIDNIEPKILLRSLGYRIMSDINSVSVVMPTALVGTVLLTLRGRGVGYKELIRRVLWLIQQIEKKGGRVVNFGKMNVDEVVLKAIQIIKDLIGTRLGLVEPVYFAIDRFELSFYRNQVIHIFISEAIVSVAMYTIIKKGGSKTDQRIPYDELMNKVVFLSQLLKWEFVYPPKNITQNLNDTLKFLEDTGVIKVSDGYVELNEKERSSGRENYDFYCFLMWPFVESYWLASISLYTLNFTYKFLPEITISEYQFLTMIQNLGKVLYYQGDLSYLEAINKETLANAILLLKDWKVLKTLDPSKEIVLDPRFQDGNQVNLMLWELVDTIGSYRREGKNRRDNATVSFRVLRLCEMVAKQEIKSMLQSKKYPLKSKDINLQLLNERFKENEAHWKGSNQLDYNSKDYFKDLIQVEVNSKL